MSVYLSREQAGIDWLLDPENLRLRELVSEVEARRPDTPCDAAALAREAESLARLLRERHFGVATGLFEAPDDVVAAWERRLAAHPLSWGDAVGQLQLDLREALSDEHIRLPGAPPREGGASGPAVEEEVVDGVLVLHVRRLIGHQRSK